MFAALLLSAGALSDRVGRSTGIRRRPGRVRRRVGGLRAGAHHRRAGGGPVRAGRGGRGDDAVVDGADRAGLPRPGRSGHARWRCGRWAARVASSSGPVLGGLLTLVSWRLIFFINVPVGAVALVLLARTARSPQRQAPFDWIGQVTAVLAMGGLTYGAIEAGAAGFTAPRVVAAFAVAVVALVAFLRGAGPRCASDGAAGAVPVPQRVGRRRRRVRVRRRLLRAAVRDEPVPAAAAGPVVARRRAGVPADDADRRRADPVQRPPRRAAGRPAADHRRPGPDGGRPGGTRASSRPRHPVWVLAAADGARSGWRVRWSCRR